MNQKSVECIMCSKSVKIRLIANHLANHHQIQENLQNFCKLQLKGQKKLKKALKKKEKETSCWKSSKGKRQSEKEKLLHKFEKCLQEQYLDIDVFNKMLMDVSFSYHKSRVTNKPMDYDDAIDMNMSESIEKKSSDNNLKLTINLKERKVISKTNPEDLQEKQKSASNLENKTSIKKQKSLKNPKFATSTPKPRARKVKANPSITARIRGA